MTEGSGPSAPLISGPLGADLHAALAASGTGTWRWDLRTDEVRWDVTLEALCGLGPGEFGATYGAWLATLLPEEADGIVAQVEEAVRLRSSYHFEHRVRWPDGSVHWLECRGQVTVDEEGACTGTVGCAVDITERKVAEAAREAALAGERRMRDRIEFLAGLTAAAVRSEDHHAFMATACAAAVPTLGDWCSIHFIPEAGAPTEIVVAHTDPDKVAWAEALAQRYPYNPNGRSGVAAVVRTGATEFVERVDDALIDETLARSNVDSVEVREILDELGLISVITVPLCAHRGVLGAMQLVTAESGRVYDRDDVALAEAAAGRIAEALDNMWLTDEHLHISVTLQRALLPPAVPPVPGIELAVRYWPAGLASEVGGDFYDVFQTGPGRWSLLIGDVCGSGPDAAALTGIARHTVRAAARHGHDHRTVLEWVNEALLHSDRGRFATAAYATLEALDEGFRLTAIAGGHPLPVVVPADGTGPREVGTYGSLLGLLHELRLGTGTVDLREGDVAVFYTDGIYDLPPPHGLDPEEVVKLVDDATHAGSAEAIADRIGDAATERLPAQQRPDDIAIIVVRVVPPDAADA